MRSRRRTTKKGGASAGDITGVTAGDGITGGGASGSVTVAANFTATPPPTIGVANAAGSSSEVARRDHTHDGSPIKLVYGRGNSGAVTPVGTSSLSANVYATTYTVGNGVVVNTGGGGGNFVVYGTVEIDVQVGGTLQCNGGNGAASGTAGAQVGAGSLGLAGAAGAGGTTTGSNGGATTASLGAAGGAGGNGTSGNGGTGGSATAPTASRGSVLANLLFAAIGACWFGSSLTLYQGGGGGGGGGGDGASGAGGGAGGGVMVLCAPSIKNNGTVQANGGSGGTPAAGNRGGGGGGGPGAILALANVFSGSGTWQTLAGTGGSGSGTGTAGANGTTQNGVYQLTI